MSEANVSRILNQITTKVFLEVEKTRYFEVLSNYSNFIAQYLKNYWSEEKTPLIFL